MGVVNLEDYEARDQLSPPDEDPPLALSNVTGTASGTTVLNDHREHNSIAEVADFLKPIHQPLVRAKPAFNKAANGLPPLEALPHQPSVEARIFGKAADYLVNVKAIHSLKRTAHAPNQVRGR